MLKINRFLNIDPGQESSLKKAIKLMAVTVAALLGIYAAVRAGIFLAPFLIALLLSLLMEPIIKRIEIHPGIKRKWSVPVILLIIVSGSLYVIILIVIRLISEAKGLARILPEALSEWYARLERLVEEISGINGWITPEIAEGLNRIISSLYSSVARLCDAVLKSLFNTAVSLPQALIFILAVVMSTYFFSRDRPEILRSLKKLLPEDWTAGLRRIRDDMFEALSGYLKATAILMGVTFLELFAGFLIIRTDYAFLLAFLIALIDALPLLGTGSILLPWAFYNLLAGNLRMAMSLLMLFLVVLIVRQFLEPRVVGKQLGIHPLIMLVAMYAGLKLAGFAGLILGPVSFLLVKSILKWLVRPTS